MADDDRRRGARGRSVREQTHRALTPSFLNTLSGHRYEGYIQHDPLCDRAVGALLHQQHLLSSAPAFDGNHHFPAGLELLDERLGNEGRGSRHNDAVERRVLGPSLIAVTDAYFDFAIAERLQSFCRRTAERLDDLDRIDFLDELA